VTHGDEQGPAVGRTGPIFEVLTLFPEVVEGFVSAGLVGKARSRGLVEVHSTDIRDFCTDRHRTADDTPFGGGPGMVMKIEPIVAALEAVEGQRGSMHRILLTPAAPRFDQRVADRLAKLSRIGLVCGRYEGVDDRVRTHFVDECLSLGDFVLGGGEVAALAIIEAVARLCEGVLGNPESVQSESFAPRRDGVLLEHPQYTRPASFRDVDVPSVLLSGNHAEIARWREVEARRRTCTIRPDLRPPPELPQGFPVYLALSAECEAAVLEAVAGVARDHTVTGLIAVGPGAEACAIPWARAIGGRVQVAAFSGLDSLRRRLARSHRLPPAVIALIDRDDPEAIADVGELLEGVLGEDEAGSLVLWVAGTPVQDADAAFALPAPGEAGPASHPGLAPGAAMEDASPLRQPGLAQLAGLALAALGR
jgi:tRNA (guanine37-N1)-methyltransferase